MFKKFDQNHIIMAAALVVSAVIRAFCFRHESHDYTDFLLPWVEEFRAGGGLAALASTVSNYNLPYLYFLALISYLPESCDLYLIKLLSVAFDAVLAAALYRIVLPRSKRAAAWAFSAALLLPTFILNSAYWGQCDSIYAAFCLLAFERAVNDKPKASVVMAGIAFAFKLQAVFFLPFFLVLLAAKRVKLWHAALFPLPYVLLSLPALAFGWTPGRIIGIYTGQAEIYSGFLTLNAPSVYTFIPTDASNPYHNMWGGYFYIGLALAALFCLSVAAFAYVKRGGLDTARLAGLAAVITLGVPWLLPAMHDRYFYLAEAFMLLYAALRPRYAFLPVLVTAGSFGGYHAYLVLYTRSAGLWPFALLLLLALVAACRTLARRQGERENQNLLEKGADI